MWASNELLSKPGLYEISISPFFKGSILIKEGEKKGFWVYLFDFKEDMVNTRIDISFWATVERGKNIETNLDNYVRVTDNIV
jgi:hypothetical protein